MILIGICGKAQVGKDTSADYLVERYGFKKLSFASYLKEVAEFAGWDGRKDLRGRTLLNHLGDTMREYEPDVFLREMRGKISTIRRVFEDAGQEARIVVSDVRMPNEVALIRELGGVVCLVLRDIDGAPSHATETMDSSKAELADFVFDNNGSKNQLYHALESVVAVAGRDGEKSGR